MKKLLIFFLFIPHFVNAGEGSGVGKISQLYTNGSMARITFSEPIKNPDNCEKTNYYILELKDTRASDRFYSAILAAYVAQKDVSFWVAGCTSQQHWGGTRPAIIDIYMQ